MRLIHTSLFAAIAALGLTACNKPADTTRKRPRLLKPRPPSRPPNPPPTHRRP